MTSIMNLGKVDEASNPQQIQVAYTTLSPRTFNHDTKYAVRIGCRNISSGMDTAAFWMCTWK